MSSITETVAPTTNGVTSSAKQGLLYVGARFTNPDLRYEDWARWYDEIHMPHLASMSGCRAAMRYVRIVDPNAPQEQKQSSALPYLTLYPLHDVSWLHGDEFDSAKDSTEADYLPGRSIFKSVDFEGRGYELVGGSAVMGGGEGQGECQGFRSRHYYCHRFESTVKSALTRRVYRLYQVHRLHHVQASRRKCRNCRHRLRGEVLRRARCASGMSWNEPLPLLRQPAAGNGSET